MSKTFLVGISPDFYTDAKGRFEHVLATKLDGVLAYEAMPPQPDNTARAEDLDRYDAIFSLGMKYTAESLKGLKRLAVIARWGVGYDMIDIPAATASGVLIAITPQAVKRPVAEAALAYVFALAKNMREQDQIVRAGKWRGQLSRLGTCMAGRVLGSVGLGNIGQEMFRLASGLGFGRFLACDPYADAAKARALNVELVSMEELFAESDFLTVNCLLNEQTRGLVTEALLRRMKPTAFFINTARGPIVDQKALTKALQEKWILGAGIDVFEKEPPDADDPLLRLENVILAPHALAWTEEIARDNGLEACDNILAIARGEAPVASTVNKDVLARPEFQTKLERYRS
jgi:phosphoglycerate dehydrogenase-like enzyme